ncbi:IPTL-CTERM sorting domain-containing protein [Dokdonella sp.]|uniref:IPTL-CTERM sorting domain-containing protein n=1 Tax=Dokdonella sp. TaxID=2291710 RepID=UPI001B26CE8B|nr:IPTL-CTERM sorting domain-containing protein [Dokdonella sp.]MBO9662144.1 IPTL-CTERM sorting domain-containing protein [Dokdonella sp.]
MSDAPFHPAPLRRRHLAAALAAAMLAATMGENSRAAADAAWPRLRDESGWPLFGKLAGLDRRPGPSPSPAAIRTVTNCDDDGPGSLRATIAAAGESDTIDLTRLQCGRITLETGAIPIELDNLTLTGIRADRTVIDGGGRDRVFIHYGLGTLTLQKLTVSGGYYRATGHDVAFGGCIAARSYLSLDHAAVSDCKAVGVGSYGGGTFSYALLMQNSLISGNLAAGRLDDATTAGFGGGGYAYFMQIFDSAISSNRADYQADPRFNSYGIGGGLMAIRGGGIYNSTIDSNFSQGRGGGVAAFSDLRLSNSTISGNQAQAEIGGGAFLRRPSTLQMDNSTIAFNRAGRDAGGVWLNAPGSYFRSSVVFGNALDAGGDDDLGENVGNQRNNYSTAVEQTIDGNHNLIGARGPLFTLPTDTLELDPLLEPLNLNGGPTRTHALSKESPAIDHGSNPNGLASDQRGANFPRVYGAAADIGAFERQGALPPREQVPVPTLSTWMTALLATLLGLGGMRHRRRAAGRR